MATSISCLSVDPWTSCPGYKKTPLTGSAPVNEGKTPHLLERAYFTHPAGDVNPHETWAFPVAGIKRPEAEIPVLALDW